MTLRARIAEAQVAMMLLTRLPAGRIGGDAPGFAAAGWAFPLAGLAVGAVGAAAVLAALALGLPPAFAAGLALAAGALATGGIHEDGLADCADGFGGGRTRERKLEIMRDSRIGSYGGLALMLSLGLRWSALATLAELHGGLAAAALIALAAASRATMPVAMALMPPARADGLGHAAAGAAGPRPWVAVLIGIACLGLVGAAAPVALATMALAAFALAWLARRQIGGQTGDVLGAMQQTAEIAGWAAVLAVQA
ncbi:hypothetical protein CCR83_08880 [Rhodobacter veldkampii DSM 11550]|uniref:Adenosylcobinamide-GDP ribazoletransferase n=1 Tax=Phaeovulum veldkampii DSM 11550 TaxID=1185920 RepID=A0A2T4JLK8_9RHOB|nr:adenosylcobinamide-GDP ribazoletransferase [Phaeovulum veldkampii]MBK5946539.1 hypothetical protein [Phaeovulum veldkampii DSM 11550]PTE18768.1 adenosylcobinamide-GDP ribazoletransferase [Phaeovulum veldkampii DSM 11550]TDQ60018.1 cobalamin-5'-phosphate synthase [Phaeovulum veldkampii DSM 11550]